VDALIGLGRFYFSSDKDAAVKFVEIAEEVCTGLESTDCKTREALQEKERQRKRGRES
jgi:hypothetical protein